MNYKFLSGKIDFENINLADSDKINSCLLKNHKNEIIKVLEFLNSEEKYLYIHGFLGTGKRQLVNYVCEYLKGDVIKLEYFCKESTVCDDILLDFTNTMEVHAASKGVNINAKITTLSTKFEQQVNAIRKPILIILHTLDNISEENVPTVAQTFSKITKFENVKLIVTTRALKQDVLSDTEEDRKVFLKALSRELFAEFFKISGVEITQKQLEDLYSVTRGYYFYTALCFKVIQAMHLSPAELLEKIKISELSFDAFMGVTYVNLIPTAIRNFYWFLRFVRHGLSINALAVFEIYDEFSLDYMKSNLLVFQAGDMVYLQDYFAQKVDIVIPAKTAIKLHKYIIGIYESQVKEPLKTRVVMLSRQALRSEIEYHGKKIKELEKISEKNDSISKAKTPEKTENKSSLKEDDSLSEKIKIAKNLENDKKYTDALELYNKIMEDDSIGLSTLNDIRLSVGRLYKKTGENSTAEHYYELVETYYEKNKEYINLNYLHYDLAELYHILYKENRAIETAKKVVYSVDTPQSLLVNACILLGNIYTDLNNPGEAYSYYKKALDSMTDETDTEKTAELYFKFALANDEKGNTDTAFEYYNKCLSLGETTNYVALAYSNMGECYYDSNNYDDAISCFNKAYSIEKNNNNYEGIFYTSSKIAEIYNIKNDKRSLKFLKEAKQSAEFLNEPLYILEASVALGDYYYNIADKADDALKEYLAAKNISAEVQDVDNIKSLDKRIEDMELRIAEKSGKL